MRTYRLLILALGITLIVSQAIAEAPDGDATMPDPEELKAALEECAASVDSGSDGRPDHSAMESCMSAKGFTRPSGPPGHGPHGDGSAPPERPE
jgi:hypothetical protein